MLGTMAGGRTTLTPSAKAPTVPLERTGSAAKATMVHRERAGKVNGFDMATKVGECVVETEAATTKSTMRATTRRRPKTKRGAKAVGSMLRITSPNMEGHRPAAESLSTRGGKMPTLTTTKEHGATLLLRVGGQRRARLHLRVRLHRHFGKLQLANILLRRSL